MTRGSMRQEIVKNGKKWKASVQVEQPQHLVRVCKAEDVLPQDPTRPARYLNGVKLDDYEMMNIV